MFFTLAPCVMKKLKSNLMHSYYAVNSIDGRKYVSKLKTQYGFGFGKVWARLIAIFDKVVLTYWQLSWKLVNWKKAKFSFWKNLINTIPMH